MVGDETPSSRTAGENRHHVPLSRRQVLRHSTAVGALAGSGLLASGSATALPTGDDCTNYPCKQECCKKCSDACGDDVGTPDCICECCDSDDRATLTPSGHNATLMGVLVGPRRHGGHATVTARINVVLEQDGVVAKGQTTVRCRGELKDDGTVHPPTPWTVHAATRGRHPLRAGQADLAIEFDFKHDGIEGHTVKRTIAVMGPGPDLVPESVVRTDGDPVVTVLNQGTTEAGPSTTAVDFGSHGVVERETPALAAGESVDLEVSIPAGCFESDCEFTVTVDVNDVVAESNEDNNTLSGGFIG